MVDATLNGIRISYELSGSGRRLLFLNGSGSTLAASRPLLKPFRERFEDKGRFSGLLRGIPTRLILDESPALSGLANSTF